ncbi:ABC-2 family transporter protein, partial [Fusobacterium necrophorum]|nr:ABC-2 family transporter protein [Fusobacterium necrophorum]
ITTIKFALYLLLSINGFYMIYSIMFLLMTLAFWFMRMDIVMGIGSELITIGNKPISIYPNFIQKILIYILPILVCFNFPVLYLVSGLKKYFIGYSLFSGILLFIISNWIFHRGLRRYIGAGN